MGGVPTPHQSGPESGREAFSLLRRGDVVGAMAAAERGLAERWSAPLAVVAAEALVCFGRGDLDELEHLRELVRPLGDETLLLRVEATLADHHATLGNPLCGPIAAGALAAVADRQLVAADQLWARGRLWRTLALAMLFVPDGRPGRSYALLERAKADFAQAGFMAEWARCAADLHFVWTLAFCEEPERAYDTVVESLARLRQLDSSYVDLVLAYRVFLDMAKGDMRATHAGADEIDRIGATRPLHPFTRVIVGYVRVAARLLAEGPTVEVLDAVEEHLALVRSEVLAVTAGQLVGLASILVDAGHIDPEHLRLARRWATQAAAGESSTPRTADDLAGLVTRLDLLERADHEAIAAVDADLDRARRLGLRRDAAQRALRAAVAARRVGRHDVAERLYLEALADLPPSEGRWLWEDAMVAAIVATRATARLAPQLRLLGPEVTVEVGPESRALSAALARLATVLVAEGGAATTDRLVDLLWPDTDPETGRGRLRVALHRLRSVLRTDDDVDPLPRRGELVALDPTVDIDAMRFEKLAGGSPADHRAALELYRGHVAHVQLAYDDVVVPLRRRLASIWREVAQAALADPELSRATVIRIVSIAGQDAGTDPDLAALSQAAEQRLR